MAGSETLYRRGAAWYWRRRIPRRLSKFFRISTVRISTSAYLLTEARAIARAMNAVADILFAALDDLGDVSDMHVARIADQADTLLREALYGILADAEAARARAGRRTLEDAYAAQAGWLHEAEAVRRRLATNDLDAAAAPLARAAAALGLPLDVDDDRYPLLARRMLRTQEIAAKINAERELGCYDTPAVVPEPDTGLSPARPRQPVTGQPVDAVAPWSAAPAAVPQARRQTPADGDPGGAAPAAAIAEHRPAMPPADPEHAMQTVPRNATECSRLLSYHKEKEAEERRHRAMALTVREAQAMLEKKHYDEAGDWTANTADGISDAAKLFVALIGDKPLGVIEGEDVDEFKALLNFLPRNYDRNPKLRDRCPREIAESYRKRSKRRQKEDRTTVTFFAKQTINKHLAGMGRLFKALDLPNPFRGKGYDKQAITKATEQREQWSQEALDALLSSPLYTGCKSAARRGLAGTEIIEDGLYWGPLISRCMGLRQQEIAQLPVDAVHKVEEIDVIDVTDGGGRRVKGPSAKRRVPIPQALIDAGFLAFVDRQKARRQKVLFPELTVDGVGKAGEKLRKRFDNYKSKFVGKEYVFHGLRHTFATAMFNQPGVSRELVEKMMGHELQGQSGSRYFKGYDLQILKAAIDGTQVTWGNGATGSSRSGPAGPTTNVDPAIAA